jgi:transketolase
LKTEFSQGLLEAARTCPEVQLLSGDLGYGAFDAFGREFPDRFLNCGVAEQNMVGVAAGLAAEGLLPVVYSIGNFLVFRAAEQIRNDIVASGRPCLLVAAGGGFTYGAAGYSHHLYEDVAFLRSLPGLALMTPCLPSDVEPMVMDWLARPRPMYLRLDRTPAIHLTDPSRFRAGNWRIVQQGRSVGLFSMGSALELTMEASQILERQGVSCRIVDCNQLSDLSEDAVSASLEGLTLAVAVEEHSVRGGLGSLIAEELASRRSAARLLRFGLSAPYSRLAGPPGFFREQSGMTADAITDAVLEELHDSSRHSP